MKELSFLMFLIAITAILLTLCNKIFRLDQSKTVSLFPSKAKFNLTWGFIFYATYGLIIAKTAWLKIGFICIIAILAAYLLYIYMLKNFLYGKNIIFTGSITKILLWKIARQQQNDKTYKVKQYNHEQILHLLGLPAYAFEQKGLISKRIEELKNIAGKQAFKQTHLIKIIDKISKLS